MRETGRVQLMTEVLSSFGSSAELAPKGKLGQNAILLLLSLLIIFFNSSECAFS